jgi:hypothetical protein
MRKLIYATATLLVLVTPSFADQNTENETRMMEMRKSFYQMTDQMMNDQMSMMKMQESMLTNYQKLLKQMMENDLNSKH